MLTADTHACSVQLFPLRLVLNGFQTVVQYAFDDGLWSDHLLCLVTLDKTVIALENKVTVLFSREGHPMNPVKIICAIT